MDTGNREKANRRVIGWEKEVRTTISHKKRPGDGKLISQTAMIKSYCHSTLLRGRLTMVCLAFHPLQLFVLLCALSSKRSVKIYSRKNAECHFWASSSEKQNRSSDLKSDCNSKRVCKARHLWRDVECWMEQFPYSCQQNHHLRGREREREKREKEKKERKKRDHLHPYSLANGKWHLQRAECHEVDLTAAFATPVPGNSGSCTSQIKPPLQEAGLLRGRQLTSHGWCENHSSGCGCVQTPGWELCDTTAVSISHNSSSSSLSDKSNLHPQLWAPKKTKSSSLVPFKDSSTSTPQNSLVKHIC